MTEPLNQEVAEKYGYNEESFRGWTKRYINSLKLDTLNFRPINTNYSNKYVLYAKTINKYLYLDGGYIYLLKPNVKGYTHYIPVSEPFHVLKNGRGDKMNGLYAVKEGRHTICINEGFNSFNYTIIGVAPFPPTAGRFLNWKYNPLEAPE